MKIYRLQIIIIALISCFLINQSYAQSSTKDTLYHPYHVNYWVSGTICGLGALANVMGTTSRLHKVTITQDEVNALDRNQVNSFDRWALDQNPTNRDVLESYSTYGLSASILLPGLLFFDKQIRNDWAEVLMMYMETMTITNNVYEWSFLGPSFQDKYRPIVYYQKQLGFEAVNKGNYRNSFYSGHNAVVAASCYFMAKVYCDFNPQLGCNKYWIYGAATIPPLLLGYVRVKELNHFPSDVLVGLGVGALCGIIIPELHRFQNDNISLGVYSTSESTGLAMKWQPDILK